MNIFNFIEEYTISEKICDELLDYYKNNNEYKFERPDIKNTKEVHFFNDSNNTIIKVFFKNLAVCAKKYLDKYNIKDSVTTSITNKIQHYKPKTGFDWLHYERDTKYKNRQLVYMLYLNTVNDKGGTEFPFQNITLSANKGKLVIWPAEFTHPHKGIVSPTEEKYIVTGWFEIV